MKDEKLYAERDHRALKPRYSGDISAMTAEDLREKGDILDKLVRREEGGDDMSKLREAARAVVDQWDTPNWNLDMHTGVLIDRLRAALAQPETAEPVAWAVVCAGNAVSTCLTETAANLIAENLREKNRGRDFDWQTTPLYAHPPRDEWRPASEPPACTRSVLVWLKFGDVETFGKTLGGPSGFAFQNGAITHWRDVTPPTESTIAAKCQRIEGSGEICGLTPPCPDCGSSLIDVPEGSL